MTTTSYPAAGAGGYTITEWQSQVGAYSDGIIGDITATALDNVRIDATDMCRILPGKVQVAGYVLEVTSAHDLYCAPVASGAAVTYFISAQYDPALNVPDGSGNASSQGPCRLVITAGPPSLAGGKTYVLLYTVTRSPSQVLSAAVQADYRRWTGPFLDVSSVPRDPTTQEPTFPIGFGPFARGTQVYDRATRATYRFTYRSGELKMLNEVEDPRTLPIPNALRAWSQTPEYYFNRSRVYLRGDIKRSDDSPLLTANTTNDLVVGNLPETFRPGQTKRYSLYAGGRRGPAFVKIGSDGEILLYASGTQIDWIDLSPISFEVGF